MELVTSWHSRCVHGVAVRVDTLSDRNGTILSSLKPKSRKRAVLEGRIGKCLCILFQSSTHLVVNTEILSLSKSVGKNFQH